MNKPEGLLKSSDALKNKTEQNKEMAVEAKKAADSALNNTTDPQAVHFEQYSRHKN